jgi:hypothetical protein
VAKNIPCFHVSSPEHHPFEHHTPGTMRIERQRSEAMGLLKWFEADKSRAQGENWLADWHKQHETCEDAEKLASLDWLLGMGLYLRNRYIYCNRSRARTRLRRLFNHGFFSTDEDELSRHLHDFLLWRQSHGGPNRPELGEFLHTPLGSEWLVSRERESKRGHDGHC